LTEHCFEAAAAKAITGSNSELGMPHFYYDISDGNVLEDRRGLDCDDLVEAIEYADQLAATVAVDHPRLFRQDVLHQSSGQESRPSMVVVRDEQREEVYRALVTLPFARKARAER
jgi:hypothetical protein